MSEQERITTAEELDALPVWTVVESGGVCWTKSQGSSFCWESPAANIGATSSGLALPAIVLWKPTRGVRMSERRILANQLKIADMVEKEPIRSQSEYEELSRRLLAAGFAVSDQPVDAAWLRRRLERVEGAG